MYILYLFKFIFIRFHDGIKSETGYQLNKHPIFFRQFNKRKANTFETNISFSCWSTIILRHHTSEFPTWIVDTDVLSSTLAAAHSDRDLLTTRTSRQKCKIVKTTTKLMWINIISKHFLANKNQQKNDKIEKIQNQQKQWILLKTVKISIANQENVINLKLSKRKKYQIK